MKLIKGHKSWNQSEIIEIFAKTGSHSCPSLPHWRYDEAKKVFRTLRDLGLIEKSGQCDTSIAYRRTAFFKLWQLELEEGITDLGAIRWAKMKRAERIAS